MLELSIAPAARADLLGIWDSIAEGNPEAADRFLFATEQTTTQLTHHPGLGRERRFARFRGINLRSWSVKGFRNYLVFYYATEDCLNVVRVAHGARDLEAFFRENPPA
ncbi:MAG: hypothetical protein RL514_968 [Verrucomicrobiota bacterium]|jgi:toxin ParE1/3/4